MKHIAVFASGNGSNLQAIINASATNKLHANIALVVSDNPSSYALKRAKDQNIPIFSFRVKDYPNKATYEKEIVDTCHKYHIDLIVLAGYMRLLGKTMLSSYPKQIINIHPSLLPKYRGLDAVGQAMKANDPITGVTIHYVDSGMDTGEIIAQEPVKIEHLKTREDIEATIHKIEHKLYPKVIQMILEANNETSID